MADGGATKKSSGQLRGEDALRQKFIILALRFARTMSDTFPECDPTAAAASVLALAQKDSERADDLMHGYYNAIKPQFGACSERDIDALLGIESGFLNDIDLKSKWPILEQLESEGVAWDYIIGLNTYVRMRYDVSAEMLRCIEEEGHALAARIANKEVTLETLDMQEIGQRVVDRMKASDSSIIKQANVLLDILNDNPVFRNVLTDVIKSHNK